MRLKQIVLIMALMLTSSVSASESVEARFHRILGASPIKGAALVIIRDHKVAGDYYYGVMDAEGKRSVDASTVFRAGSVSKWATSLIALRLTQHGLLDLNRPVSDYAPQWLSDTNPYARQFTLAHLLEHTAGLTQASYGDFANFGNDAAPSAHLSRIQGLRPAWSPGLVYLYANTGHTAAGALIEHATQRTFDAVAQAELFDPLGMPSASFRTLGKEPSAVSASFTKFGSPVGVWAMDMRPAGALSATPLDLSKLVVMALSQGQAQNGQRYLEVSAIERMHQGLTSLAARQGLRGASYGLGNFGFQVAEHIFRGHWGKTEGFLTNVGYLPGTGRGFVLMSNTADESTMRMLREAVAEELTGDLATPARAQPVPTPSLARYMGYYTAFADDIAHRHWLFHFLSTRSVRLSADGKALEVAQRTGLDSRTLRYLPVGAELFQADSVTVPTAAWLSTETDTLWIDGDAFRRVPLLWAGLQWAALAAMITLAAVSALAMGFRLVKRPTQPLVLLTWVCLGFAGASALAACAVYIQYGILGNAHQLDALSRPTAVSLALAAFSLAAVIAGALGLVLAWRVQRVAKGIERIGVLLCGAAAGAVAVGLASQGWAPLITWRV
jgi:CubicO group peptidase (beta-lactamase class C family)